MTPFLTQKSLGLYDIISKDPQMIHRLNLCTFLTRIYHHIDREQKIRLKGYFQDIQSSQLSGRLFSPSDICKKLSHHFLLYFPIGMGSYDHHAKYQGAFPQLLKSTFFIRVPPLNYLNFLSPKGDPHEESVFQELRKHTLIFCVVVIGTHTNWKIK